MISIAPNRIQAYRDRTFRLQPGERIATVDEAVDYANQRGFIYFWPIKGIILPSLWSAVAGDRPVADAHDDPGHVTWGWKDSLLGKDRWYYAKVLRKKATIIALNTLPYFYALSENYGAYEDDYLTLYEQGRMTREAKAIFEALLDEGPLDTVALRRITHLASRESDYPFTRALTELQAKFMVMPVGVTRSGGWNYAFAYDIVARRLADLPDRAHAIREREAREHLVELYLRSTGAVELRDIVRLFGWRPAEAERAVDALVRAGTLVKSAPGDSHPGGWIVLAELI